MEIHLPNMGFWVSITSLWAKFYQSGFIPLDFFFDDIESSVFIYMGKKGNGIG